MNKAEKVKSIALSPGISVILALLGAAALLFLWSGSWLSVIFSALTAAFMIATVKGRSLFRGQFFPIAAIFFWLQAAVGATDSGSLLALIAVFAIAVQFVCFAEPDNRKLLFIINLALGLGALASRSYAFLAVGLFVPAVLLHIFSLRGLVASLLGFVTPLVITAGFGLYNPLRLADLYASRWFVDFDAASVDSASVALLSVLLTFFKAYGYPAKMRAGNMALIGLTLIACVFPFVDFANASAYLPLINLCAAYNLTHFAATTRFGWVLGMIVCLASGVAAFFALL